MGGAFQQAIQRSARERLDFFAPTHRRGRKILERRLGFQRSQLFNPRQFLHRMSRLRIHHHRDKLFALFVRDQRRLEVEAHVMAHRARFGLARRFDQPGIREGQRRAGQVGQAVLIQPHLVDVQPATQRLAAC